jgi:hypothetical protein
MKLIATWTLDQDPATDEPIRVSWEDGQPATMADFAHIDGRTQSDPYIGSQTVEYGYEVVA